MSRVFVALNETVLGAIDLADPDRPGAGDAVAWLQERGLAPEIMSGDGADPVAAAGER